MEPSVNCPDPVALLRAWSEGDADPTLRRHVVDCRYCQKLQSRWTALARATPATVTGALGAGVDCPDEGTLVDYVGARLSDREASRLRTHVAACRHCLGQLAEVVVGLDQPLPAVAPEDAAAVQAAHRLANPVDRTSGRSWLAPAAAAAAALVVVLFVGRFRDAGEHPGALPVATQSPVRQALTPMFDEPALTAPLEGQHLTRSQVVLRWQPVANTERYRATLLDASGNVVWEVVTTTTRVALPAETRLDFGRHFVWVEAELVSGRIRRSPSVEFELLAGPAGP